MGRPGGYFGPQQSRLGRPNKVNAVVRKRIEESGDPVGFLMSIMNGEAIPRLDKSGKITAYDEPTIEQRITAARELLRKIVPDLKAIEVKGSGDGQPVIFEINTSVSPPNSQPQQLLHARKHVLNGFQQISEVVANEVIDDD